MRIPMSILVVIAAMLLVSQVRPHEGAALAAKDQSDDSIKKVKELKKERIAVLKKMNEQFDKLLLAGRVEYAQVLQGVRSLSEAELEAAETDAARAEIYKHLIVVLKTHEQWLTDRFNAGRGMEVSILKAKAERLQAEIHLEQARMMAAKPGK